MARTKQVRPKILLLVVVSVICTFVIAIGCTIALIRSPKYDPISSESNTVKTEQDVVDTLSEAPRRYGVPTKLEIAAIGVVSDIQLVGLTPKGDMDDPNTNDKVGWYKYGARPGNEGTAVIAGHYGLKGDAVFGKLGQLKKGDIVSIVDDRNQVVFFTVRETRIYPSDAAPSEVFSSTEGAHLNLITCDGDWNSSQNTFAERLVVFTDKLE